MWHHRPGTGTQDLFVPRPAVRKLWQSRVTCALKELHRLENQRQKQMRNWKRPMVSCHLQKEKESLLGVKNAAYIITNGKYISESSFKKNDTAESLKNNLFFGISNKKTSISRIRLQSFPFHFGFATALTMAGTLTGGSHRLGMALGTVCGSWDALQIQHF